MMVEQSSEQAFNAAAGAIARALVEVLRDEGVLSDQAAKRVYLKAKQHLTGLPNPAKSDEILSKLAREIPGNG